VQPEQPDRRFQLPRGLIILLGLAAGVIVLFGMRQVAAIIAPLFTSLCLTITVYPIRTWMRAKGAPSWLATLVLVLGIYALIIGLVVSLIWGAARFATILPQYTAQMQSTIADLKSWVAGLGIGADQIQAMLSNIDTGKVFSLVGSVLGSALSLVSVLVFIITLVLFMGIDGAVFPERMERVRSGRADAVIALKSFAHGTRTYFAVATVFGGIVAVLDGIALIAFGIPGAALWALIAFVTNYIPNVGFIIGLIPVSFLALLTGGVGTMFALIVVYCVLNFIIQSVIQPKYVGDSVGLTTTVSFLSLIIWAFVLGPLGAILAVPATLLAKAVLVDVDPDARWLQLFLGDEPVYESRKEKRDRKAAAALRPAAPLPKPEG
jgi:AI-2 transport protein TqsA